MKQRPCRWPQASRMGIFCYDMATIDFTRNGDEWTAEATVHGDYVVHIERKGPGKFSLMQRSTQSGQWAPCWPMSGQMVYNAGQVIDHAFGHGVYPSGGMHIRFISGSEVTMAEINEGA